MRRRGQHEGQERGEEGREIARIAHRRDYARRGVGVGKVEPEPLCEAAEGDEAEDRSEADEDDCQGLDVSDDIRDDHQEDDIGQMDGQIIRRIVDPARPEEREEGEAEEGRVGDGALRQDEPCIAPRRPQGDIDQEQSEGRIVDEGLEGVEEEGHRAGGEGDEDGDRHEPRRDQPRLAHSHGPILFASLG